MTTEADQTDRRCPACSCDLPAGRFCGGCGADQRAEVTERRKLLRPAVFVAAHRQPIYLPLITSTLCPHLSSADRTPFRHGLFLAAAALIGVSMLKILPLMVVLTTLGIPLLFLLYLWRSGIFRDIPARALMAAPLIGVALSVTWWVWTAKQVAEAYGIPLYAGFQLFEVLDTGLAVAIGDTALMLVPAVLVRLLRPPAMGALDGFVVGALGALAYSTAGTLTWLSPQYVEGLLDNYDAWRLLSQGLLNGVLDPLAAAAAGGAMGLLLWFRPSLRAGRPRRPRAKLAACAALASCCYVVLYLVDASYLSRGAETAINLLVTVIALLTLRFAMQIAVLHEQPWQVRGELIRCIHCAATVPDTPFCPRCGVAGRASSRSARRLRPAPTG